MTGATVDVAALDRGDRFVGMLEVGKQEVGKQESLEVASGSWFSLLAARAVDCLVRFRGVSTTGSEECKLAIASSVGCSYPREKV